MKQYLSKAICNNGKRETVKLTGIQQEQQRVAIEYKRNPKRFKWKL